MKAIITSDEWQEEMSRLDATGFLKPIPRGWFTTWDEVGRLGIGYSAASKRLNERWRRGLLDRQRRPNPAGTGSPIFIYRPVKKK